MTGQVVPFAYNRLVLYDSRRLHVGAADPLELARAAVFGQSPASGRLSLNSFLLPVGPWTTSTWRNRMQKAKGRIRAAVKPSGSQEVLAEG